MAKARQPEILAAGTVLVRTVGARREICLVHRPTHQDWSLPKGKLDPGENVIAAAWRETVEETGEHVALGVRLSPQFYVTEGKLKRVDYWVGRVSNGGPGFRSNREIDQLAWLPPGDAVAKLTYRRDRELVTAALRAPATSPLILVRHGEAMRRARWGKRDDAKRPLSANGRRQAGELAGVLAAFGVVAVHSSDSKRCLQTLEPFVRASGIKVELEPKLSEAGFADNPGAAARRMAQLLKVRQPIVVCTHRPLLPDLLRRVRDELALPRSKAIDEPLPPGGLLVFHRHPFGRNRMRVADVERHEL